MRKWREDLSSTGESQIEEKGSSWRMLVFMKMSYLRSFGGKGAGMRKVDCGRVGFGDCFKRTRRPRDERPE